MKKMNYNLILLLNKERTHILMCYRTKDPYLGLYNLLGGKIEKEEDPLESAYRELYEESGITKQDTILTPFMDFVWHPIDMDMRVYFGVLNKTVNLKKEIHPLYWIPITEDFFDTSKFAGEGNIGHMIMLYHEWDKNE